MVGALVGMRGGSDSRRTTALPTTGAFAPISVVKPKVYYLGGAPINEPEGSLQEYLSLIMSKLPGSHRYRLTITNASNVGFINAFQWYPPSGVRIVKLIGSSSGRCSLGGLSGFGGNQFKGVVLYPNIRCNGLDLKPPTCTCRGDGGSVAVSVVFDRDTAYSGNTELLSATPVLRITPSYVK
jgi:hypothetical protein